MDSPEIIPITQDHIDSFHRALDFVARERRYLAFREAPPIESTRAFVSNMIKRGYPQYVLSRLEMSSAGAISRPRKGRSMPMAAFSEWPCCHSSGDGESERN
jgi:hypothetical protein